MIPEGLRRGARVAIVGEEATERRGYYYVESVVGDEVRLHRLAELANEGVWDVSMPLARVEVSEPVAKARRRKGKRK